MPKNAEKKTSEEQAIPPIVLVGERVRSLCPVEVPQRPVSTSKTQNVVHAGEPIPSGTLFEVTGIRNGYTMKHEHQVLAAHWSVLKFVHLKVVQCSDASLLDTEITMVGASARTALQRLPQAEQSSDEYKQNLDLFNANQLNSSVRYTTR